MPTPGERLARAQYDGMIALDRVYAGLARNVEAAVLSRATPDQRGIARLSLPARALILTEIGRLLDGVRGALLTAIMTAVGAAERAAQFGRTPLPRDLGQAIATTGVVWRALGTDRASVIGQSGALLVRGIATGQPARAVARDVKQYFSPFFAPRWDERGRVLLRADREGAVSHWPGRAGMASAHPRTVMLTETTAAHSRVMRRLAERDGELLKYELSYQHDEADECDDLSRRDNGWGPGVYTYRDVPNLPRHPRCRCHLSTVARPLTVAELERIA